MNIENNTDIDLDNITLLTDSYKIPHWYMLDESTDGVYSYSESRAGAKFPVTQFAMLQMYLKMFLQGKVVTKDRIAEGQDFALNHFGFDKFNSRMWNHILDRYNGYLPIRIRAVPEGMVIPIGNPLMTVETTDRLLQTAGLTNHLETILTHNWFPSNVATIGYTIKQYFKAALEKSADNLDMLPFMLHDFGFRGTSSVQSAGIGGAAHLINFLGTDTIPGIQYGRKYYNTREMLGFSVAASEHSIKTQFAEEGEAGEFRVTEDLIRKFPDGILSDVRDSFNIMRAIDHAGTELKTKILARNGKYVFRPDSKRFEGDTPDKQLVDIAQKLDHYFGSFVNKKGYKVLHPKIGIIYGDGLSMEEIFRSVDALMAAGYSADTSLYGMGGGLLQKHNRDTQRLAFKSSAQLRNGVWHDVFKNPEGGNKASKKGRIETFRDDNGNIVTALQGTPGLEPLMTTVFENGYITKDYSFKELRDNANIEVKY